MGVFISHGSDSHFSVRIAPPQPASSASEVTIIIASLLLCTIGSDVGGQPLENVVHGLRIQAGIGAIVARHYLGYHQL